jgi:hypothetical protein
MQMSTKLYRTLHGFAEGITVKCRRRWQDGRGCRSFSPEHSETLQSISKHLVTSRCHSLRFVAELAGPLASADDLKRGAAPPAVDRFHDPGGRARQKPPATISMATHCVHAGPTSRHTRQSRLPDREAERGRRGLNGRRAVVTRIQGGAPTALQSLVLRSVSRPGLGLASLVRGV